MKSSIYYFPALVVFLFCSACSHHKKEAPKDFNPISDSILNSVKTVLVKSETENDFLKLNGKIEPNEARQAKVFALVSGRVESVNVELGDFVKKGQLLAVIKSTEVADVSNNLSLAQSNVTMTKKNMETTKELYDGRLTTEQEYLNATIAYNKAVSELTRATQVAAITGGNSSNYLVQSPINGYIIEKHITNDSEVRQDNSNTLFSIADLSTVWIIANVYETDMNKVTTGDEVGVKTLANPEKTYLGKINKIYNVLDPDTRTMRVRISMENPDNELKPEMFVTVKVNVKATGNALEIPSQAIVMDNSKYYVVVKKEKKLEVKEVIVVKRVDEKSFIVGLTAGDAVVVSSQVFLYQALSAN